MTVHCPPTSRPRSRPIEPMGLPAMKLMESASRHPSPRSSDEECADCARAIGCAACFEELVRRFQSPLLHFLIRRIGSHHDAEDLLQETFLIAHRKISDYRSSWRFSTWLFTIAHRLAVSKRRRRWFRPLADPNPPGQFSGDDPLANAQDKERHSKLWDEIAGILHADAFTALWLNYVESMSAQEIGRILNRSPNSVRILLHRARARLLERIGPDWKPGADS
jgi:RNA polymerase sigma-70 factor, ECF subfamily